METVDLADRDAAERRLIYKHSTRGRMAHKFYYWRIGPKKRFLKMGVMAGILAGLVVIGVWLL